MTRSDSSGTTQPAASGVAAGVLPAMNALLCVALGVIFVIGVADGVMSGSPGDEASFVTSPMDLAALLGRTIGVAGVIAIITTLLAVWPAWRMRRMSFRWVGLFCAPLLLPTYLTYASWNLMRAPGSFLGDRLAVASAFWRDRADEVVAIGGLALWAWPIAAIVLMARARRVDPNALDALRLATSSRWRRGLMIASMIRSGLLGSFVIIFLLMLGSAIPLHVAQVRTYAIVIWQWMTESSGAGAWIAATPLLGVGVVAGWWLGGRLLRDGSATAATGVASDGGRRRGSLWPVAVLWGASVVVPAVLFAWNLDAPAAAFRAPFGFPEAFAGSAATAMWVTLWSVVIAIGTCLGLSGRAGGGMRRITALSLRLWLIGALIPGVLVGQALSHVGNHTWGAWLAESNSGVVAAHLVRFGAIGALAGWWVAWLEPQTLRDVRQLFGGGGFRAWFASVGRLESGAFIGSALATGVLSLHEIEAGVMLAPPGVDQLSRRILDLLHYLRQDELVVVGLWLLSGGVIAGALVGVAIGSSADLLHRIRVA